uniref:Reverse transcriptase domain-containing protein n=1 Tax=Heliothis virescens TaxID=7102 RepID=A0A2A4J025_HELVI
MLNDLDRESRAVGLNMNLEKTKAMTNGKPDPVLVNNQIIEYVNEYVYLGQIISPQDLSNKEIDRRIGNAWKQYWSFKEAMKNKETSISIKRKLFNTCILPVLTYGCQSWALNQTHYRKLETCQNAMERSMVGKRLSDKIRTSTIRKYTKIKDVTVTIRKLKWKWAGHTVRGTDKWSKTILFWFTSNRKRKRGRPLRRWVDDIKNTAGKRWTTLANNRTKWKELGEAFAYNRHTEGADN